MPLNPDGSLRAYNPLEIAQFGLGTRGIRDGSNPTETYSPDGSGCERKWLCHWTNRFDVLKMLLGEVVLYNQPNTLISRTMPQAHPNHPQWICVRASVTGHLFLDEDVGPPGDGSNLLPRWDAAEITANYEMTGLSLLDDAALVVAGGNEILRYVTLPGYPGAETEQFTEYINLPGGIMRYLTPTGIPPHGKIVQHNIGIPMVGEKVHAIWRRVPQAALDPGSVWSNLVHGDPLNDVRPWIGSLNGDTIFGRPPLTMLLESAVPNLRPDPLGDSYVYDVTFTWIYRAQTHIFFYFYDTIPGAPANGFTLVGVGPNWFDPNFILINPAGDTVTLHYARKHSVGLFAVH